MIEALNQNAGAVTGAATVALLLVTAFYAWTTHRLFKEAKVSRMLAGEPRVVAYFRVNEVHPNIAQMCIANLSSAAAVNVSARMDKVTEWPNKFYLEDSKILRDLSYLRPHEVLRFDVGMGPDLFKNDEPAVFQVTINYSALDGRTYCFYDRLRVESIEGHSHFRIYGTDDVARRLKDIADTLKGFTGFKRVRVDTFTSRDRKEERDMHERQRAAAIAQQQEKKGD
jgi:heme-degrading monooxygenase HmoA